MRAVVQRVLRAQVRVDQKIVGEIGAGLCVFVGVSRDDASTDAKQLAKKLAALRIFSDAADKMNLSVRDVGGAVLAISQFTLCADTRKGTRPSFMLAMDPGPALVLFDDFCARLEEESVKVQTGRFGADMQVELVNSGPVTIFLDTQRGRS